ncbi:MAG: RagB/SusD family nutrient uptake outer membrane protein [Prevotella sp.]|jgi:hypothetical protein|nr:RagB/SusD family nutrient uptake outer membrane protein [Prevotella sp.]
MKKIFLLLAAITLLSGCSESFLDVDDLTKKNSQNFPKTPADAEQMLPAIYRTLIEPNNPRTPFFVSEIMSDERFGAAGADDRFARAIANFKVTDVNEYFTLWDNYYKGIFRANSLISSLDNVTWDNEEQRNQIEGEAYFMRAYYYFDLARLFGTVPLVLDPLPQNNPRTEASVLFAQIGADLKMAIEKLPTTPYTPAWGAANLGHATKWAAEGIMARAFLFYTGYYKQETMGEITKAQVIAWVDDCVKNSGHDLLPDFRSLWPYSYSKDYPYTKDNGLTYMGESGANIEAMFVHRHYGWDYTGRNLEQLFYGMRYQDDYKACFPFGQGWGGGTVNPNTFAAWPTGDLRRKASILDAKDPSEGVTYQPGKENQMEDTWLFGKKYMPINVKKEDGSLLAYIKDMNPNYAFPTLDYMSENLQDYISLRFADVLLMGAELGSGQAQSYLDRVRTRVKLPSVPVNIENIKAERRWELAFEGVRYFDLLRWHDENLITEHKTNVPVLNRGVDAKVNTKFRSETGGFLPVPLNQIELSGGVLIQTPGWEPSDFTFTE